MNLIEAEQREQEIARAAAEGRKPNFDGPLPSPATFVAEEIEIEDGGIRGPGQEVEPVTADSNPVETEVSETEFDALVESGEVVEEAPVEVKPVSRRK